MLVFSLFGVFRILSKICKFAKITQMKSDKIRIESILANGEHINLECKKATNIIPNSIWETYSSFANTYGGTILLGIVENLKEKDILVRVNGKKNGKWEVK